MSENKEKDKEVKDLEFNQEFNDLNDLLEWMASPRVHWDNFAITIPIKNPNEIKWFSLRVSEA